MNKRGLVVYLLFICCVFPSAFSSHFLGGSIMVRPKRGALQSEMEITSHISWTRSNVYCNSSTVVNNNNITVTTTGFRCQYSCQDSFSIPFFCIEYSVDDNWSYLEGHETRVFNVSDKKAVTIGTVSNAWISPFSRWNISTTFSLVTRTDTGEINSTPRVVSFPYFNLLEGFTYNIPLPVIDPDNDRTQCRWALGIECSSVCNGIPGAILDPNSCTITYTANYGTGVKAIAIMVEDFGPCSFRPLSSVSHQFVVNVVSTSFLSCSSPPRIVSPLHGTCINIPLGSYFTNQLVATSGCSNIAITSIQIIAPIGVTKNGPYPYVFDIYSYYINVQWTPTASQRNDTHFLCFMAVNSENSASEQHCINLAVGYHPPTPLPESATPNHQLVYPSNITLHITFDRRIQRPKSTSAFIKFYKSQELVYQINALSLEVSFVGPNLIIMPNYVFTEGNVYYINFDGGIVESIEGCHLSNDPINSQTFWTFEVINLMPDVTAVNNQTEGQPLILQCSVTTIRDINSRVDFVWISNGIELRRVEGVIGEPTVSNLAAYTDHYIIPQLSNADNNSLYICEVIVNRNQLISATGNIILNITGMAVMNDSHINGTNQSCSSLPQFDEQTLPQGACASIPPGTLFIKQIMASSGCSNIDILSIKVFAPNGTSVGELQHVQGTNHYYINVAWMPTTDQQSSTHSLCFVAVNLVRLSSVPFCMHLAAGYYPPIPFPGSATHQIHSSIHILQITFSRNIQRPSTSAFIRFYKPGKEVYHIDVSLSTEVTFVQSNLTIKPNYFFTGGSTYYVNFDGGVVESSETVEGCHLANDPILSETFWTFGASDSTTGTEVMDATCDNDKSIPFIICFALSAVVNLVLVAVITLTCLFMKHKKKVLTIFRTDDRQHTYAAEDDVYEIPEVQPEVKDKQVSPHYVNAPRRQKKKLPPTPKRHLKPGTGASDIKLEGNPSYGTPEYRNY